MSDTTPLTSDGLRLALDEVRERVDQRTEEHITNPDVSHIVHAINNLTRAVLLVAEPIEDTRLAEAGSFRVIDDEADRLGGS